MAEEKFDENNTDDQQILSALMQKVKGLTIVSYPPAATIDVEADEGM